MQNSNLARETGKTTKQTNIKKWKVKALCFCFIISAFLCVGCNQAGTPVAGEDTTVKNEAETSAVGDDTTEKNEAETTVSDTEETVSDTIIADPDSEPTAKREEELLNMIKSIPGVKDFKDGVIYTDVESFNQHFDFFNWLNSYCMSVKGSQDDAWKDLVRELSPYIKAMSVGECYIVWEDISVGDLYPTSISFRGNTAELTRYYGADISWKLTVFDDTAIFEKSCDNWIISEKGVFSELREQYEHTSSQRYRRLYSIEDGKLICERFPNKFCCYCTPTDIIDTCGGIGELRWEKSVVSFAQDGSPIYTVFEAKYVTREYLQKQYDNAILSEPNLPSLDEMLAEAAKRYEMVK